MFFCVCQGITQDVLMKEAGCLTICVCLEMPLGVALMLK